MNCKSVKKFAISLISNKIALKEIFLNFFSPMAYRAAWLPVVSYCTEWATYGLPIFGSPSKSEEILL